MAGVVVANQPGVYLVDEDGNVVTLDDGATIGTAEGILIAGKDGTVARFLRVNASGQLAIQNPPNLDAAISTLATEATLATRASEVTLAAAAASLSSIDVSVDVLLSTRASEITLAAVAASVASLDTNFDVLLSTRASESTLATRLADATFTGRINTLGQKAMAASTPVVLPSDQSPIPVTGPLTDAELRATPVPVNGTVTANIGATGGLALEVTLLTRATEVTAAATAASVASIDTDFDVPLSSRASQATLATRASEVTLAAVAASVASIDTDIDIALSTRASEATALTLLTTAAFQARINTLGQKLMAASTPVVIASDQTVIPVSDNGGSITVDTPQLPAALVGGRLDTNIGAWLGSTAPTVGQKTSASSVPVVISSDQSNLPFNLTQVAGNAVTTHAAGEILLAVEGRAADGAAAVGNPVLVGGYDGTNAQTILTDTSGRTRMVGAAAQAAAVVGDPVLIAGEDASGNVQRLRTAALPPVGTTPGVVVRPIAAQTGTVTSVASSATNVTLLAANTSRLAARITNDGNKKLYVKCAATASATSFTKLILAGEDWLVDAGYTGTIDGIWDVANGSARITEYT